MDSVSALQPAPSFAIGGVLSRLFSIIFKRIGLFVSLALVAALIALVTQSWLVPTILSGFPEARQPFSSPLFHLSWAVLFQSFAVAIGNNLLLGAFSFAVYQVSQGNPVTFFQAISALFKNFPNLLAAAIVYSVISSLSAFAFYVPIFFIVCFLSATIPACQVERVGVVAGLKRSLYLTRGCRLKILMLFVLLAILIIGVQWTQTLIQQSGFWPTIYTAIGALSLLFRTMTVMISSVFYAVIYCALRATKEGSVAGLERVFD